jgi:hypothetical protein
MTCGDWTCSPSYGESCSTCPEDCGACSPTCGNGVCDGDELCSSCPEDCGQCCSAPLDVQVIPDHYEYGRPTTGFSTMINTDGAMQYCFTSSGVVGVCYDDQCYGDGGPDGSCVSDPVWPLPPVLPGSCYVDGGPGGQCNLPSGYLGYCNTPSGYVGFCNGSQCFFDHDFIGYCYMDAHAR